MRNRYDEQLMLLNKEMIEIGAMCEESIEFVSKALVEKKYAIVDSVVPLVKQINEMFGTNISVELSSSWKKIRTEIENREEIQEVEIENLEDNQEPETQESPEEENENKDVETE